MQALNLQQVILYGINGLPNESIKEIADFVLFVRKKTLDPETFNQELQYDLVNQELKRMSKSEQQHLEEEFANYQKKYPFE